MISVREDVRLIMVSAVGNNVRIVVIMMIV